MRPEDREFFEENRRKFVEMVEKYRRLDILEEARKLLQTPINHYTSFNGVLVNNIYYTPKQEQFYL